MLNRWREGIREKSMILLFVAEAPSENVLLFIFLVLFYIMKIVREICLIQIELLYAL